MADTPKPRRRWWLALITLGLVAALAWHWATSRYEEYLKRHRFTEVFAVAHSCRASVAEFAEEKRTLPGSAREAGCPDGPTAITSGVKVSGGRVEVTIANFDRDVDGSIVILEAMRELDKGVRARPGEVIAGWRCATNAPPEAYFRFPANCRQRPLPP
jgi:hypothetical protein